MKLGNTVFKGAHEGCFSSNCGVPGYGGYRVIQREVVLSIIFFVWIVFMCVFGILDF